MPLHFNPERTRRTQELRRSIQSLTRYEPNYLTSDDDKEVNAARSNVLLEKKHGFFEVGAASTKHAQTVLTQASHTSALQETGRYKTQINCYDSEVY